MEHGTVLVLLNFLIPHWNDILERYAKKSFNLWKTEEWLTERLTKKPIFFHVTEKSGWGKWETV